MKPEANQPFCTIGSKGRFTGGRYNYLPAIPEEPLSMGQRMALAEDRISRLERQMWAVEGKNLEKSSAPSKERTLVTKGGEGDKGGTNN